MTDPVEESIMDLISDPGDELYTVALFGVNTVLLNAPVAEEIFEALKDEYDDYDFVVTDKNNLSWNRQSETVEVEGNAY